jgi:xylulokinase
MAAMQNAGLALVWVRRLLGASWRVVYEEAFSVLAGAGGVTFLPYLSGERTPHLDPEARGAWVGLGLDHERGHLLRAALEGVAFACARAWRRSKRPG